MTELGQLVRYSSVGVFNTIFAFAIFAILQSPRACGLPYLLALVISHLVSVLEAFFAQRILVFKVKGNLVNDLLRFWSVYLTALGANLLLLPGLVEGMNLPVIPTQGAILATLAVLTYIVNRNFSFKR
jgi:putative flippase GtrA